VNETGIKRRKWGRGNQSKRVICTYSKGVKKGKKVHE
jgi:hypothetical protein